MKKIISILFVSFVCSYVFSQTTIDAIVSKKNSICVFDSLYDGRTIVKYIYSDSIEDYFLCIIEQITDDYAFMCGRYTFDSSEEIICGWIQVDVIETYPGVFDTLCFYEVPDYNASRNIIDSPAWVPLKIKDIYKDWVFVLYRDKYRECEGWVNKKMLCANPYTVCN